MKRHILRHLPTLVGAGILVATFSVCAPANAQWLPDRDHTEGPGIRLGERLELHPGVAFRAGYDTNVFRADDDIDGSGLMAITPHLNLSTIGPQRRAGEGEGTPVQAPPKVQFSSGASVSYIYYFEDLPPRGVEADFGGVLNLYEGRPVNAQFDLNYGRTIRPFVQDPGGTRPNYDRDEIVPGAQIGFASRGGVLTANVGYRPQILLYEDGGATQPDFSYLNVARHEVPVNIGWKFLPHTALLHDSKITVQRYFDPAGSNVALSDGTIYRGRLGVNGAVTRKISVRGMAGFTASFFDVDTVSEVQEPVGEVALTYSFAQTNKFSAIYHHDVNPSFVGAWQKYDKGELRLDLLIMRAFSLSANAGVGRYVFGRLVTPGNDALGFGDVTDREDLRVDFGLHAEYRVTDYLAFLADFTGRVVDTDFVYDPMALGGMAPPDPAEFTTYQVFGGIRAFY